MEFRQFVLKHFGLHGGLTSSLTAMILLSEYTIVDSSQRYFYKMLFDEPAI